MNPNPAISEVHFPQRPAHDIAVACKEVQVRLGDFNLGPVTLEAPLGEVTAIAGPNGSGKTTLLHSMVGLRKTTSGDMVVLGRTVSRRNQGFFNHVGFAPDGDDYLIPELTQTETIDLHALAHDRGLSTRAQLVHRAEALGGWLQLDAGRLLVDAYSHGMKSKLQIVTALLHDPDVVILDEPLNGLDPIAGEKLELLITELRDRGRCVIVSSHDLAFVERISDSVAILDRGSLMLHERSVDLISGFGSLRKCFMDIAMANQDLV